MDFWSYPHLQDFLQGIPPLLQQPAFLEHLLKKIDEHIAQQGKILILTLTKKHSEEVTNFLLSRGYKAFYLHSEISPIDRREIIKKLRHGSIDIIVWVNLLREGIDLPEVTLLAILDADKEWFLRSTTSLIQIIGRASRNPHSEVILYADVFTESIIKALWENYRRRHIQEEYNQEHGIIPQKAVSQVKWLDVVKTDDDMTQSFDLLEKRFTKKLKKITKKEKDIILADLKQQLDQAIEEWRFEDAAMIRDQIKAITGE